jgi:hypothetical protein
MNIVTESFFHSFGGAYRLISHLSLQQMDYLGLQNK